MDDRRVPTMAEERRLWTQGYKLVAGIDEAGRGSLAGPVMAAAVILPPRVRGSWADRVRDSKLLSERQREELYDPICENAVAFAVGSVDSWTIEAIGIARATQIAMTQAISQLSPAPQALLIDYFTLPHVKLPQKGVENGDTLCFSIACASIIAKVTRDRLMAHFDEIYPGYYFARHKGYSTEEHMALIRRLGPCPIHRRTFQPVRDALPPR